MIAGNCVPLGIEPSEMANTIFQTILNEFSNVGNQDQVIATLKKLMVEERKATLSRLEEEARIIMGSMENLNNI